MKRFKKCLGMIAAIALVLCMTVIPSKAADYTYTITISAGTKGSGSIAPITAHYGDVINLADYEGYITPEEGYYLKGFHEIGREDIVGSVTVGRDTTYVAAYGKHGSQPEVTYTVRYVDKANGQELAEAVTGTGFAGDQAIVPYKVIENYMPDAYNLRMRLVAGGENTFTFEYTYIGASTVIHTVVVNGQTRYEYADNNTPGNGTQGAPTGTNPATQQDGQKPETDNNNQNPGNGQSNTQTDNPSGESVEDGDHPELPVEVIDQDSMEVPLAEKPSDKDQSTGLSTSQKIMIGIGAAVVIIIIFAVFYIRLLMKRKRK